MTLGARVQHRTQGWWATVVARPHNWSPAIDKTPLLQDGAWMVTGWPPNDLRAAGDVAGAPQTERLRTVGAQPS